MDWWNMEVREALELAASQAGWIMLQMCAMLSSELRIVLW
jgi:hypothetical protein